MGSSGIKSVIIQKYAQNIKEEIVNRTAALHFPFSSSWFSIPTSYDTRVIWQLSLLKTCFEVFHENKVEWVVKS